MNVLASAEVHGSDLIAALRQFTDRTVRERRVRLHWQVSAHALPDVAGASGAAFLFQRLMKG